MASRPPSEAQPRTGARTEEPSPRPTAVVPPQRRRRDAFSIYAELYALRLEDPARSAQPRS